MIFGYLSVVKYWSMNIVANDNPEPILANLDNVTSRQKLNDQYI